MSTRTYRLLAVVLCCWSAAAQDDKTGYFWILNDLHYDPLYPDVGSSCNENLTVPVGKYGDFMCDPPWTLMESSVRALARHGREPAFIVWLGDSAPHIQDKSLLTEELVFEVLRNMTALLNSTFPDIPILPVVGNHDYHPVNQLPGGSSPQYDRMADMWRPWLGDEAEKFRTNGGFYMKRVSAPGEEPVTWAIVLNTNLYNTRNTAAAGADPGGQFAWLEARAAELRGLGEKAHLFIHIAPGMLELDTGVHFFNAEHNVRFHQILQDAADVLLGIHAGHAHTDSFRMVYNDAAPVSTMSPVSTIYISPSVTPWMARLAGGSYGAPHNPAVRKVLFWSSNHSLADYEQYYLDLPKANGGVVEEWTRLYSFKLKYKVPDISPASMQLAMSSMKEFGSALFHEYYLLNTVLVVEPVPPPCGCSCKQRHLCSMEFIDIEAYGACMADPGYTCGASASWISAALVVAVMLLGQCCLW